MIAFESVTFNYAESPHPQLRDVHFHIPEGELALVIGETGSGKSTLLNLVCGLAPHFTGGTLQGDVRVAGRSTAVNPPRELADVVGVVRQDPLAGFVTEIVEDELAYTMESLGVEPATMRRRVEETLDLLGLADLRSRPLRSLSGGERQRVAIGSVMTAHPSVLVLDEPTSALDPQAAEEVLAAVQRLVYDLGLTVMVTEHRLERVLQYADSVVLVNEDSTVQHFSDPATAMTSAPVHPPIVELGMLADWQPLPLTIRDARRRAGPLRERIEVQGAGDPVATPPETVTRTKRSDLATAVAGIDALTFSHGTRPVLRNVDLTIDPGEIIALMGRNGAGKSTLLSLLVGSRTPAHGRVQVDGKDPASLTGSELISTVTLVPQEPEVLLWAESVAQECEAADHDSGAEPGTARNLLEQLHPGLQDDTHPGDLSEGTRLALVLAIMLTGNPQLLLLDEPTRGLDYQAKQRLCAILRRRASAGQAILVATHDVELVAELCSRVVIIADGEVVVDSDARSAVVSSPIFAPQVAKVMAPQPLLTVAEVQAALDGTTWPRGTS